MVRKTHLWLQHDPSSTSLQRSISSPKTRGSLLEDELKFESWITRTHFCCPALWPEALIFLFLLTFEVFDEVFDMVFWTIRKTATHQTRIYTNPQPKENTPTDPIESKMPSDPSESSKNFCNRTRPGPEALVELVDSNRIRCLSSQTRTKSFFDLVICLRTFQQLRNFICNLVLTGRNAAKKLQTTLQNKPSLKGLITRHW